ncbi:MAG: iron-containing redox enzyme family protein [Nostocales cyanobacterium 94392]|nr:iron-containing redox enzyme family protein [Nostocales cyanobacterium 94392]
MEIREYIEASYSKQVNFFEESEAFQCLVSGDADKAFYDNFIGNICQTHLKSPQILAFLYSAAPPTVAPHIMHNMLEELGLDEEGISHPSLLYKLADSARFTEEMMQQLENGFQEELKELMSEPFLFGTLKEFGLSVLLEVTCFEWMLSRLSSRIGKALEQYHHLSAASLEWFYHHSEVDIRHAEEGLDSVVNYIEYYGFDQENLSAIIDITFRENIFIKRYFGEFALVMETQMI